MKALSDEELQGLTGKFKAQLKAGKTTEQILPEAFAAMCEADRRMLGMYPYDVQILGAVAMHYGYLTEMNTGEGKTLTATLPLYLNALTGKSTILVTANEFLAYRDAEEMRPAFEFMGLNERAGVSQTSGKFLTNDEKRENYNADVLYTTHSVLAFDYLLDHLVMRAEDRFMREFYFVIIDEADSVLLDGAQMPLVISGSMRGEKVEKYIEGERHVSRRKLRRLIDGAQETMEEQAVASREQSVRYDEVLRRQRDILYDARDRLLNRESISKETIQAIVRDNLARFIETHPDMHESDLNRFILDNLSYELDVERVHITGEGRSARKHLLESLVSYAGELFEKKRELFAGENQFQDYVRHCILIAMSDAWTEEVDYLQQLQFATMTRGTAQRNPVFEYSREAYKSFNDMKNMMKRDIARNFFLGDPQYDDKGEMHIILP